MNNFKVGDLVIIRGLEDYEGQYGHITGAWDDYYVVDLGNEEVGVWSSHLWLLGD